jgi:hypothetical protein
MKRLLRVPTILLTGAICFALLGVAANGQLVEKESAGAGGYWGTTTVSCTFGNTPAPGDFLIAIACADVNTTINVPSGWATAINESGSLSQAVFYKVAGSSESKTVTVTTSSNAVLGLQIYEYQGISPVSPVDGTNSNTGYGTSITTNSVTTTQAPDLIIVGVVLKTSATFSNWQNSFAEWVDCTVGTSGSRLRTIAGADRIVNAIGTYGTTTTASQSGSWRAQIVAFKGVSALPIQMASFAANVVRNNDVEVAWKTVSETNNYGFEIYRKRGDAGDWTNIGFVEGHGTTLAAQSYSYLDRSLSFGKYYYQIRQIDLDGTSETFPLMEVTVGVAPEKIVLAQNYPNPFNPSTLIEFVVPMSGHATMTVYNVLGQEVATLFEGNAEAGRINTARFNASDLPSGLYFYTLRSAGQTETRRMLLTK